MDFTRSTCRFRPRETAGRARSYGILLAGVLTVSCHAHESLVPPDLIEVGSIVIDTVSFAIERGTSATLRATVKDPSGKPIVVPVVWRSTQDSIAEFDANGRLVARDTGVVGITASSLGVSSPTLGVLVVWNGPATIEALAVAPGAAISPSATLNDSIRVRVKNRLGAPLAGARVQFSVSAGGGSISPAIVITDGAGRAATALTLGPATGDNTVLGAAVDEDGVPLTRVTGNPATFTFTSYLPIIPVAGDGQTAQILSPVPVAPVVKLVDASGAPRIGVPITFNATRGGRVEVATASTGADGTASPGTWTLGDIPGDQELIVTVESATFSFLATATGTPIYYTPAQIIAGAFSTCGIGSDQIVSCWGQAPQNGGDDANNRSTPSPIAGGVAFTSVTGGPTHFCGVATDQSIYCWGTNALADTSGVTISTAKPTRVGSAISWRQVSPGSAHNCAIAADNTAYCWGDDFFGQLGDRAAATRFKPTLVSGGFTFKMISAGTAHSCGLTLDSDALCWGANNSGQLGESTTSDRNSPTLVVGSLKFQSIGAGDVWTCGLSLTGIAHCWGALVGSAPVSSPQAMAGAPAFTSLSVGGGHACALTADGTAYCWGANGFGQVGDSTTTSRATPVKVVTTMKFASISAGFAHTCGRTIEGPVACWGRNRAGELGDNIATFRTTPRYVVLGVNP